jgi:hypothetical protein
MVIGRPGWPLRGNPGLAGGTPLAFLVGTAGACAVVGSADPTYAASACTSEMLPILGIVSKRRIEHVKWPVRYFELVHLIVRLAGAGGHFAV